MDWWVSCWPCPGWNQLAEHWQYPWHRVTIILNDFGIPIIGDHEMKWVGSIVDRVRHLSSQIYLSEKAPVWVPISLLLLYLIAGSVLFAIWEGWSYIDGAYFSFITFTTIGFGDLVPGEGTLDYRNGRSLLCAMYLLFGVMLTAMCLASIQEDINRMKSYLLQRLGFDQISLTNSDQI